MKTVTVWKNKLFKKILNGKDETVLCNIFYNAAGKGVAMVSFFALDILIAKLLGYNAYNEWNFAFAIITGFRWIARFGIDSAGKSYVASSGENSSNYIAAALDLQLIVFVIFVVLLEVVLKRAYSVFHPLPQYGHLEVILAVGIVYAGLYAIYSTLKECFVGTVEFKKVFILTTLEYVGYLILSVLGMQLWGIYGLILAFTLSLLVSIAGGSVLRPSPGLSYQARKTFRKDIFRYAKYIAFANVGDLILTEMDSLMLGIMRSDEVGIYAVGKNLMAKATNIPLIICVSCMTAFAVINKSNVSEKEKQYRGILKKNGMIIGLISCAFVVLGKAYVNVFYGAEYKQSYIVICILVIYFALYSLSIYQWTLLNYHKQGKWILLSQIVLVGLNFMLNIYFISGYGAIGAAIATSVAMIPSCIIQGVGIKCLFNAYKEKRHE